MSTASDLPNYGIFLQTFCVADAGAMDQYMGAFRSVLVRNNQVAGNSTIGLSKELNESAAKASAIHLHRLLSDCEKIVTPDAIDYVESMKGTPKVQYFGAFEAISRFPQRAGHGTASVIYEIKDRPFKTLIGTLQVSATVGLLLVTVSR